MQQYLVLLQVSDLSGLTHSKKNVIPIIIISKIMSQKDMGDLQGQRVTSGPEGDEGGNSSRGLPKGNF